LDVRDHVGRLLPALRVNARRRVDLLEEPLLLRRLGGLVDLPEHRVGPGRLDALELLVVAVGRALGDQQSGLVSALDVTGLELLLRGLALLAGGVVAHRAARALRVGLAARRGPEEHHGPNDDRDADERADADELAEPQRPGRAGRADGRRTALE